MRYFTGQFLHSTDLIGRFAVGINIRIFACPTARSYTVRKISIGEPSTLGPIHTT